MVAVRSVSYIPPFSTLLLDDENFQLITSRPVGPDEYGGIFWLIMEWTGEPQVCGINATRTGHHSGTAKVEAGSTIGFRAFGTSWDGVKAPRPVSSTEGILLKRC